MFFGTISGGAASALTGGNFWQGAVTGLVVSGLNHALHDAFDDGSSISLSKVDKEIELMGWNPDCVPDYNIGTINEMLQLSPELKRIMGLSKNKIKFSLSETNRFKGPYGEVKRNSSDTVTLYRKAFASIKLLFITMGHEMNHAYHNVSGLRASWKTNSSYRDNHSEALAYWWQSNWDPNSQFTKKMFNHHNNLAPLSNYEKYGK